MFRVSLADITNLLLSMRLSLECLLVALVAVVVVVVVVVVIVVVVVVVGSNSLLTDTTV